MRKLALPIFLIALFPCYSALANHDDYNSRNQEQPGTAGDVGSTSEAKASDVKRGGLMDEVVGIKPQVGVVNYRDLLGNTANRGTIGFTAEMNAASLIGNATGMGDLKSLYIGPQTGFFYSHLGAGNGNFFGSSPDDQSLSGTPGANMFYIPADLKIGYNIGPFRAGVHGGGNIFYRSVASSFALGVDPDNSSGSAWSFMPNLGLDLEAGVTNAFSVILRPDITFGGSSRVWSASLGAAIPLG